MSVRIVILRQGSPHILMQWDEEDSTTLHLERWEKGSCLWPSDLLNNQSEPLEIFLCLDRETLANGYDGPFISRTIQQAHKSMWGAKVYIVVDNALLLDGQKQFSASREKWFEILLNSAVYDVLQWEVNRGKWAVHSITNLNEAAARAENRLKEFVARHSIGLWKCLLHRPPDHGSEHASFLSQYLIRSVSQINNSNCLVVLHDGYDDDAIRYIKDEVFTAISNNKVIVGVVDQVEEPSQELKEVCREYGCEPVWFHGLFEMYYFLQRLNEANQKHEEQANIAIPVQTSENRIFKAHSPQSRNSQEPSILITHSFSLTDERGCHIAANDVWQLTKDLRGRGKATIYPAVECVKLPDVLKEVGHILVWIHIGHGDGKKGLQQAGGLYKKPDDWLNSFAGYESSLPLIVFASCRSEVIAEHFAVGGAGVTVGFADKVAKKVCVYLTSRVVQAALDSNGSREAILKAFNEGRQVLKIEDPDAVPLAFMSIP